MKISSSIISSLFAHGVFMAVVMFGVWEVEIIEPERASFEEFVDHTHQVTLSAPVANEPEVEAAEEPRALEPEIATTAASDRTVEPAPDEKRGVEKVAQKEKEDVKEPVVVAQNDPVEEPPVKEDPVEEVTTPTPPAKTIVPIVAAASKEEETPRATTEIAARNNAPVQTTEAASANAKKPRSPQRVGHAARGASDVGTKQGPGIGGGVDHDGLIRAYRKRVHGLVKSKTAPPRAARRARIEGTVYLLVTFDEKGEILAVKVRKSSGHEILDEDAIATVKGLRRLPSPPGELGWGKKSLTIPIRYKRS